MRDVHWLGRLLIWLPIVAIACLIILFEGFTLYLDLSRQTNLVLHLLVMAMTAAVAYLISNFISRLVRQARQDLQRKNEELAILEKRFRALIENSSDGIALLTAEGRVLYASPPTTRIIGHEVDELAGRDVFALIHPDDRETVRARFGETTQEPGAFAATSFRARHQDGSWRWIGCVASNLLAEPSVRAIVVNFRDITARKQAEAALRRAHDELDMRVRERTADLEEANQVLKVNQAQLAGIIGSAMDAIITIEADRRIILFNAAAEEVFRCPAAEAIGGPLDRFVPERYRERHGDQIRDFAATGVTRRRLGRLHPVSGLRADGEEFPAEISISKVEVGGRKLYTAVLRDITERLQAEESLRESEGRFRLLLDSTAEAIYGLDLHGKVTFTNPACLRMLGYNDPGALLGRNMHALTHHTRPDGTPYPEEACRISQAFRQGKGTHVDDEVLWRADGTSFAAEYWSFPMRRGGVLIGVVVTFLDITERKRMEEDLRRSREQLRDLAFHLEGAREAERTRISREIHDELGQALTGVMADLSWLAARVPKDQPALGRKIERMVALVDGTVRSMRRIAADLRPSILDDLGLEPAIEWQLHEFQSRTGIDGLFTSTLGDSRVDGKVSTAVFRICQEALTNVARHAAASMVDIHLRAEAEHLSLAVEDNGRGITKSQIADQGSLGLLGIRERAHLLGGKATIVGRPGKGTTLTVRIPLTSAPVGAGWEGSWPRHSGDCQA